MLERLWRQFGLIPDASGHPMGVVQSIEISVIAAALLGVLFFRLRQPAMLAYIVAGLVLGSIAGPALGTAVTVMEQISHLGLILLLFIIGLEMDLKGLFRLGYRTAAAVLFQGPLTVAVVWLALYSLHQAQALPKLFGTDPRTWFFFATAAALSSTAVTIKLLADKFELIGQAGKVTVLTLIAQDIWAVLALSYASSFRSEAADAPHPLWVLLGVLVTTLIMVALARQVLSRIFITMARAPELIALLALGWCFIGSAAFSKVGLSAEMGALVAGLTLGTLPTATEVLAKVSSLRDFFMALFFVALGLSLPPPTIAVIGAALALILVVILSRLLLFAPLLLKAKLGPQIAFTASINLAQVSEFALLLVPIGLASDLLDPSSGSVISYAMMLSVLISTYAIKYNDTLASWLCRALPRSLGRRCVGSQAPPPDAESSVTILVLGFHHNTRALLRYLVGTRPDLIPGILVIDTNLKNHAWIRALGVQVAYGDVANPETLRHHGIDRVEVVLSTVADTYLRGTTNRRLLTLITSLNPRARFIGTAATTQDRDDLLRDGAFGAVCPADTAASWYAELVQCGGKLAHSS